jgi:hypothetical protein
MFVPAGNYALTTAFTFGGQSNVTVLISAGVTLTGVALPAATGTNAFLDLRGVGGAIPLSGGATLTGNLLFSPDITYNIGQSLGFRPAIVFSPQFQVERSAAASGWFRSHPALANLELGSISNSDLDFITNSIGRWRITSAGTLQADADNTTDIGASGANRPRNIYVGSSVTNNGYGTVGGAPALGAFTVAARSTTDVAITVRTVASQTADFLQLQNSGTNPIFQFTSSASMVNGIQFNPANTGGLISIRAIGTDANVGLQISSKGNASVAIVTSDLLHTVGNFVDVASSVNFLQFSPSVTGSPVSIQSAGTDASIGLSLLSKGAAGGITLTAGLSANMGFTAGAYQFTGSPVFFRDGNNNTTLQLAQVASAVNAIQISPSATGGRLAIAAVGTDAAVALDIDPKGAQQLRLAQNAVGSDIVWGRPLVALGGGAAPTFGTIGGTGPATAAQNTWMRVVDSTGVAFFVPAWK